MVNAAGTFFIVLFVLVVVAAVGWVVFTQLRARRLGLPAPPLSSYNPFARSEPSPYGPPQPATGGIKGWFSDKMRGFRSSNNRSAAGAYEAPSRGAAGRRGFGPLDPDEAWDSRVGHEADAGGYYGFEEQELGLRGRSMDLDHGRYGGADYEMNMPRPGDGDRGRTMSRSPGVGGGALNVPGGAHHGGGNPFDDDAEPSNISMRGVSPRPIDTGVGAAAVAHKKMAGQTGDSPTSVNTERRSIFRENV